MKLLLAGAIQATLDAEIGEYGHLTLGSRFHDKPDDTSKVRTVVTRLGEVDLEVPTGYRTKIFDRFPKYQSELIKLLTVFVIMGNPTSDHARLIAEGLCSRALSRRSIATISRQLDSELARFVWRELQRKHPESHCAHRPLGRAFAYDDA